MMNRILAAAILLVVLPATSVYAWTKREDAHGKTIIAYYASWQWYDRDSLAKPSNLDHSKVTRYNFAFFQINEKGDIWGTDSWADSIVLLGDQDWNPAEGAVQYCSWDAPGEPPACGARQYETGLISQAHSAGVEVYPSIGGWTLSDNFPKLAANPTSRVDFANNCVKLIEAYDFDGIDIDWEYPGYADHMGTPEDTVNYSLFLEEIRKALDALGQTKGRSYGLTAALPCGPDLIDNIQIDVVKDYLDELNLMTYDFHGTWNTNTGANAPLYDMDGSPDLSVHTCVEMWLNGGGRAEQINIGLPFYGRSFAGTGLTGFGQTHLGTADNAAWSDDEGSPQYFNIVAGLATFTTGWDEQTKTAYAFSGAGFVSYDDERAICYKTEYAIDNQLNGFIIWEISGDLLEDSSTPLLDAMIGRLNSNDPTDRCNSVALVPTDSADKEQWYPDAYGCTSSVPPPPYIAKFFLTQDECCKDNYCRPPDVTPPPVVPVENGQWYPDAYGCTSSVPPPPYIARFFLTQDECCKENYCRQPDVTPPPISPLNPSPTPPSIQSPAPGPTILNPAPVNVANTEPTSTVDSALSDGVLSVTNNLTPANSVTAESPPTLITQDGNLSVSQSNGDFIQNFYPVFGVSEGCRNDANAPEWITNDMIKFSKLECCESYFPSSFEKCNANNLFYPNFHDGSCVNDGKHPQWMGGAYLVETMELCCRSFSRNSESQQRCNSLGREMRY